MACTRVVQLDHNYQRATGYLGMRPNATLHEWHRADSAVAALEYTPGPSLDDLRQSSEDPSWQDPPGLSAAQGADLLRMVQEISNDWEDDGQPLSPPHDVADSCPPLWGLSGQ